MDIKLYIESACRELADYVAGVDGFVASLGQPGKFESSSLRANKPEEYIRNVLAVSILTYLNRAEFLKTEKRIIVLPDCLKNYSDWDCSKETDGNISSCTQCHPECIVYEIEDWLACGNTTIILEPEELEKYFAVLNNDNKNIGVVGVACPLTLLSGFHSTLKYKFPTQGVFLNYSSCAHHWVKGGINTAFNIKRLSWIMNESNPDISETNFIDGPTYSLIKEPLSPDDFYGRIDKLCERFISEYLPLFKKEFPNLDIFDLSLEISRAIVPNLITRNES
ncbi:MAG: DUF116 domain-containing protein [candidate division Zixibacteria bacterium]